MSNTWLNTGLSPLDPGAIQKVKPHDARATVRRVNSGRRTRVMVKEAKHSAVPIFIGERRLDN
jgi:hypothetical protein